jgi:hypothetical protein
VHLTDNVGLKFRVDIGEKKKLSISEFFRDLGFEVFNDI